MSFHTRTISYHIWKTHILIYACICIWQFALKKAYWWWAPIARPFTTSCPSNRLTNSQVSSWELTYPPPKGTFEDDFPFPQVGYVSSLGRAGSNESLFGSARMITPWCLIQFSYEAWRGIALRSLDQRHWLLGFGRKGDVWLWYFERFWSFKSELCSGRFLKTNSSVGHLRQISYLSANADALVIGIGGACLGYLSHAQTVKKLSWINLLTGKSSS